MMRNLPNIECWDCEPEDNRFMKYVFMESERSDEIGLNDPISVAVFQCGKCGRYRRQDYDPKAPALSR